ncbi:MAG: TonB-dependent receptor, partial [Ignavibacteriaceae bacterium]|nr:TonB-dependent receptor [Ignavibacteriaceae bacterium]
MKKLLSFLFFIFSITLLAQTPGSITGKVFDAKNNEPLPGVNVIIKGTYYGAATDLGGNFTIKNISPGSYNVDISFIGYKTTQFTGIIIESNQVKHLDVKLQESVLTLEQDVIVIGEKPLLDVEETQSKRTISREDIENSIVESVADVVVQQAGVVKSDNAIHIRGGRSYENAFLLDGVSVQDPLAGTGFGLQLSANSIEEVEVITGGYNAEFGQATSGVVNVKTREGGNSYHAYLSYKRDNLGNETSPHVFNIDILEANFSGPEPITSSLLPLIGAKIPGEITFFGNFYVGLSDGITQGYYKPEPYQLVSSTFHQSRFA